MNGPIMSEQLNKRTYQFHNNGPLALRNNISNKSFNVTRESYNANNSFFFTILVSRRDAKSTIIFCYSAILKIFATSPNKNVNIFIKSDWSQFFQNIDHV